MSLYASSVLYIYILSGFLLNLINLLQLFLEASPGVEALAVIGQVERVDDCEVGYGAAFQHGVVEEGTNCILHLRELFF